MKPDYKNWLPKGMILSVLVADFAMLVLFFVFLFTGIATAKTRTVLLFVFAALFVFLLSALIKFTVMHNAFSYNGKKQISRKIIEGVAEHISLSDGKACLDVGCGSGALTIACAKRNPNAKIIGIDRWGKEYASFSKELCEKNAEAEGVSNVEFQKGDAVKLDFPDETFDAVTSNYVYHNISGKDKQALIKETLRVLKKGGTFAIHDLMSYLRYGDMNAFKDELLNQGYKKVELIDTTNGMFMSKLEAKMLALSGSTLLVGIK